MSNIFALRSTDPRGLLGATDPVGPDCDRLLVEPGEPIGTTLVAWGSGSTGALRRLVAARVAQVVGMLGSDLYCLGTTLDGSPRHPLYVGYGVRMQSWSPVISGVS